MCLPLRSLISRAMPGPQLKRFLWGLQLAASLAIARGLLSIGTAQAQELQGGFHTDIDGISVSSGSHHVCALEQKPGNKLGGSLKCWGYDHHGQASPPLVRPRLLC
jgi:hypothetical protein